MFTLHFRYECHCWKWNSSIQQVDYNQVIIDNQSIFTAEKILKNAKEMAKCTITWLDYPEDQSSYRNRSRIFWINVLLNSLSMAKSENSENPVRRLFESQCTTALLHFVPTLCQLSQVISINRKIAHLWSCGSHDNPADSSFMIFIELSRSNDFIFPE